MQPIRPAAVYDVIKNNQTAIMLKKREKYVFGRLIWTYWSFLASIKVRSVHAYLYRTSSQSMLFQSKKNSKTSVIVATVIRESKTITCLGNGRKNLERNQAQLEESILL